MQRWLRPKYLLFGFIGLMFLYVLRVDEFFLVDARDPEWAHIATFKWWLLPHGLAAGCALLLGPMQFSERLRRGHLTLHRWGGRVYVVAACIGAPLGAYIQHFEEQTMGATHSFTIETIFQGGLWMATTLIAYVLILQGRKEQHRQWMTRSFGTGPLIFMEVRVIFGLFNITSPQAQETVVWSCTLCAVFVADFVLQVEDWLKSRRRVKERQQAPAALATGLG